MERGKLGRGRQGKLGRSLSSSREYMQGGLSTNTQMYVDPVTFLPSGQVSQQPPDTTTTAKLYDNADSVRLVTAPRSVFTSKGILGGGSLVVTFEEGVRYLVVFRFKFYTYLSLVHVVSRWYALCYTMSLTTSLHLQSVPNTDSTSLSAIYGRLTIGPECCSGLATIRFRSPANPSSPPPRLIYSLTSQLHLYTTVSHNHLCLALQTTYQ